jgi:hypothetical protein
MSRKAGMGAKATVREQVFHRSFAPVRTGFHFFVAVFLHWAIASDHPKYASHHANVELFFPTLSFVSGLGLGQRRHPTIRPKKVDHVPVLFDAAHALNMLIETIAGIRAWLICVPGVFENAEQ